MGCASNLTLQFQSDARLNVFQPGWANAGDTGSHRSEGDKYNLDVVVKSSQGSEHMVHTNRWHLRGKKLKFSAGSRCAKRTLKCFIGYFFVVFQSYSSRGKISPKLSIVSTHVTLPICLLKCLCGSGVMVRFWLGRMLLTRDETPLLI